MSMSVGILTFFVIDRSACSGGYLAVATLSFRGMAFDVLLFLEGLLVWLEIPWVVLVPPFVRKLVILVLAGALLPTQGLKQNYFSFF